MSQRLRTLHLETGRQALGGPMQVIYLVKGLRERGHEAYLVCPSDSGVRQRAEAAGIDDVITLPFAGDVDISLIPRLRALIRHLKPDVVHLHSRRGADTLGGIAARMAGAPVVILSRRVDNPIKRGFASRMIYGRLCDHVIAISNGVKAALLEGGVDPGRITLVRSVVDPRPFQQGGDAERIRREFGFGPETNVLAIVAQLIERKGHRFLFQAMPRILKEFPDTKVLVLGQGELDASLRQMALDLGISDRIVFAGFRNDIDQVLSTVTALVHPATMEGLGIAILQAMSAGIPAVASAVGGIPEAVHDGENGILIPPSDSEAVAEGVLRLLRDPDLRTRLGSEARRTMQEEFGVDSMVEGVLAVYRRVLKDKGFAPD